MTRCSRAASINLKSSVYNPNGQSYFNQLATYNSMACHLRRILTAKSVVQTRNERYTRSKQRQELKSDKAKRTLMRSPSCEIIDRLAYDTEHHPADILRATSSSKSHCYRKSRKSDCDEDYSMYSRCCQKLKAKSQSPCKHEDCWYNKKYTKSMSEKRKSNHKGETKCQMTKRDQSPAYSSSFASDDSSPHRSGDESNESKYLSSNKLALHAEKEEARYAQFVYDITQDIVRKGLYTDKEFKEVFRKHLEKNAAVLDKHRMLYEIYQLKISLNIDEEDDEDSEHLANYIYSKRFPATLKPKPPTPPKVLDENKVVEKLKNYEQLMDKQPGVNVSSKKNVVLVDANPEILITERDILQTLIETNVDPNQAEHICRTLFYKSKDTSLCHMVTKSILEQRTKLQKIKSHEEAHSRSEEKQQKIREADIADKKMERISSAERIQRTEMKNAESTSTSAVSNIMPEYKNEDTDYSTRSDYRQSKSSSIDNQKIKKSSLSSDLSKKDELPSIIHEENENEEESYLDDYEEEVLTDRDDSEAMTYTRDFQEESKSDQKDSTRIDEQYSDSQKQKSGLKEDNKVESINEKFSDQDDSEEERDIKIAALRKKLSKPKYRSNSRYNLSANYDPNSKLENENRTPARRQNYSYKRFIYENNSDSY